MEKINELEHEFSVECEIALKHKKGNRFDYMELHYFKALKLGIAISEYYQNINDEAKHHEWIIINKTIDDILSNKYDIQKISSVDAYDSLIPCVFEVYSKANAGTGFLVAIDKKEDHQELFFITNKHVVLDKYSYQIANKSHSLVLDVEKVIKSDDYDMALIKAKATSKKEFVPVRFAKMDGVKEGVPVYLLGNRSGLGLGFIAGYVGSFRLEKILMNATTEPGTSGSPVFDIYGSVIGINCGDICEIPYSINAKYIIDFMNKQNITPLYQKKVKY